MPCYAFSKNEECVHVWVREHGRIVGFCDYCWSVYRSEWLLFASAKIPKSSEKMQSVDPIGPFRTPRRVISHRQQSCVDVIISNVSYCLFRRNAVLWDDYFSNKTNNKIRTCFLFHRYLNLFNLCKTYTSLHILSLNVPSFLYFDKMQ